MRKFEEPVYRIVKNILWFIIGFALFGIVTLIYYVFSTGGVQEYRMINAFLMIQLLIGFVYVAFKLTTKYWDICCDKEKRKTDKDYRRFVRHVGIFGWLFNCFLVYFGLSDIYHSHSDGWVILGIGTLNLVGSLFNSRK